MVAPAGYGLSGVNVTVLPFTVYVPAIPLLLFQLFITFSVALFTVAGSRIWLKLMMICCVFDALVDPLEMLVLATVSPPVAATVPVVKLLLYGTTVLPFASLKPLTWMVYVVPAARLAAGTKVSVWLLVMLTIPVTGVEPLSSWIELWFQLVESRGALSVAVTCALSGMPVAVGSGVTVTVGPVVSVPPLV